MSSYLICRADRSTDDVLIGLQDNGASDRTGPTTRYSAATASRAWTGRRSRSISARSTLFIIRIAKSAEHAEQMGSGLTALRINPAQSFRPRRDRARPRIPRASCSSIARRQALSTPTARPDEREPETGTSAEGQDAPIGRSPTTRPSFRRTRQWRHAFPPMAARRGPTRC